MSTKNENGDTHHEAESILTELVLHQDPSRRLAAAVAANNRVAQQCKDAILRANPGISLQDVGRRFIELNYGQELANDVRNLLAENR